MKARPGVLGLLALLACGRQQTVVPASMPALGTSADERWLRSVVSGQVHGMAEPDAVVRVQESVPAIEAQGRPELAGCDRCPEVPFGFANKAWLEFRGKMQDGDIVVYYRNGQRFWDGLAGSEGYAIIRDGRVTAFFVVAVS